MNTIYRCKHLKGRRLKTFLALADRIVPTDEDSESGGTMLTAGVVDWALHRLEPTLRGKLLMLLFAIELLGFFFGGKPFSKNSPTARDQQLRWLENNNIRLLRMGFFGLKTFVAMGYYTRKDAWETMNYDGPVLPHRVYPDTTIRMICQGEMEVVS